MQPILKKSTPEEWAAYYRECAKRCLDDANKLHEDGDTEQADEMMGRHMRFQIRALEMLENQ